MNGITITMWLLAGNFVDGDNIKVSVGKRVGLVFNR